MRLRQIALVGQELAQAKADIEAVLGVIRPYEDPGVGKYGLTNAVWAVGDTFLEVVSPVQDGTTAGRLLEKRDGDGGYMAIFQTEDLAAARDRAAKAGVRVIDQVDRANVAMTHLHPKDIGGCIVSIDRMVPPEHWEWAGENWEFNVKTEVSTGIRGAELQGEDPKAMAAKWGEVLGRPVQDMGKSWRIPLDRGGELRFVSPRDGRGEGLAAFDVAVRNSNKVRAVAAARGCIDKAGSVVLCGTRVRLVSA